MEFSIKAVARVAGAQRLAAIVVRIRNPRKLTLAADPLDRISDGYISEASCAVAIRSRSTGRYA